MSSRLIAVALTGLVALGALGFAVGDDDSDEATQEEHDRFMAAKLVSSQNILSDLTHGDFESLEGNARRMQVISLLQQWMRDTNFEHKSEYEGQINAFDFATKELIRHASDQNIEGALQAYLDMTTSCVHCHELIRDPLE
jgi:hypothetical protein